MKVWKTFRKITAVLLAIVAMAAVQCFPQVCSAVSNKMFYVSQAQSLALADSEDIKKIYNEIFLKKMKYTEAVSGIQAKAKNKGTFRWTPLLSFKFPQPLNYIEDYELTMKPAALTAEITVLQHKMNDMRFDVIDKVNRAFFDVYTAQEKMLFNGQILALTKTELSRNKARLAVGMAKQTDIDTAEKSVKKLTEDVSTLKREFELAKEELSDTVKLNLTTGYTFASPIQTADIKRQNLDGIITHALNNDQLVYETRIAESTALMGLNHGERLMREQYGSQMNLINPFISAFKNGKDVDKAVFKMEYDRMLKSFDKPWDSEFRILFWSFSKEFLKGEISGTRYVEDEMFGVYNLCMEYAAARKEREDAQKALEKQIRSEYEALVTIKNAAFSMIETQKNALLQMDRAAALNRIGKAEFDEVKEKQTDYQTIQIDVLDAMAVYNESLSAFDRLTCGAVTALLRGEDLSKDAGTAGLSIPGEDAFYYIYNDVADLTFVFGLDIPRDYEPEITHYEIWYEGVQIGTRSPIAAAIKHLTLVNAESDFLTVRVFNGDDFVGECEVDTAVPREKLPIEKTSAEEEVPAESTAGTYEVITETVGGVSTSSIQMNFDAASGIAFYKITYGEKDVFKSELTPASDKFTYLTLLISALDRAKIEFYGQNKESLGQGRFDTLTQEIIKVNS
ncbi:MAG: hypothetical protein LBR54_04545 [Oscillospiraceae bacterium]|jgi:regulator of replication initiation timing|nr:hypothetical protein [Oscillospiraceae bacterium]